MKGNKAYLGLFFIFFIFLFTNIGFSGALGTFDAGNSCFCKGDTGVVGSILCNLEKSAFYFFDAKIDCGTVDSVPSSGSFGGSGSKGGPASKGLESKKESVKQGYGSECTADEDCLDSLKCRASGSVSFCSYITNDLPDGSVCFFNEECDSEKCNSTGGAGICTGPGCKNSGDCPNGQICADEAKILTMENNSGLKGYCINSGALNSPCGPASVIGLTGVTAPTCNKGLSWSNELCKKKDYEICNVNEDCENKICRNKSNLISTDKETKMCFSNNGLINSQCTEDLDCISGVCDPTSKKCKGGLHETGCKTEADCSGGLVCDTTLNICKNQGFICTESSCGPDYFCAKNKAYVVNSIGDECIKRYTQKKDGTCYSDFDCEGELVCVLNNKKIGTSYDTGAYIFYNIEKNTDPKIVQNPISGKCGQLQQGGFCNYDSECESGFSCVNGICDVPSTTDEKLSLLTACNYGGQCESGFCEQTGNTNKCTVSNNLYLSDNFPNSRGLISNTQFVNSVADTTWADGTKYGPNCNIGLKIANKDYQGNELCEFMFGKKYGKCQDYDGVCAEFENQKYVAGLNQEENKITVRVLFEMSCIGGLTGYQEDNVYNYNLSLCQKGNIKKQCQTVFTHSTRKFCGTTGSNLVSFDKAGITFNPITDYGAFYSSTGAKAFDQSDTAGENYDSDDYDTSLPITITNGENTCELTRVSQKYSNTEDKLVSKIYVECYK